MKDRNMINFSLIKKAKVIKMIFRFRIFLHYTKINNYLKEYYGKPEKFEPYIFIERINS